MSAYKNTAAALKSDKNTSDTKKKKEKTKLPKKKVRSISKIKAELLLQLQELEKETIDLNTEASNEQDESAEEEHSVQHSISDGSTSDNVVESIEEIDVAGASCEEHNQDRDSADDHHSIESEIHDHLEEQCILFNLAAFGTSF